MKLNKVISIAMVVLMLVCASTTVFATNNATTNMFDTLKGDANLGDAGTSMGTMGNKILTLITNVGMILSVIVVAILGVKYMMGSTEEKAEYKKAMMPYLVGAVLVFSASFIGKMIYGFASSM